MKNILLTAVLLFSCAAGFSQTAEELTEQMTPKKDSITAIQARVDASGTN